MTNASRSVTSYEWLILALTIISILALSFLSSLPMDSEAMSWYATLEKSSLNPPSYAFGIVWPILYVMMSVAAWRIWRLRAQQSARIALFWFGLHLIVNLLWTVMFFGLHSPLLGLVWLVLLLLCALITKRQFCLIDRPAGLLLVPYLLWLAFATYLSATILLLN